MTEIIVIGKESVGKSALVASLTGQPAYAANFRGSTVTCDTYVGQRHTFIDTPGIVRQSDTATTRAVIERLQVSDTVLLVVQATHLDDDLADLLPLSSGKQGVVAVTFWDKVQPSQQTVYALDRVAQTAGLPLIPLDARQVSATDRERLLTALDHPHPIQPSRRLARANWRIEPRPTLLERPGLGPWLAIFLLLLPALLAVWLANRVAELVDPVVSGLVEPLIALLRGLPSPWLEVLSGDYGLLSMGPLLFVWAVPTVVLYALLLGAYKASGLLDRITVAIQPLIRPFGLSGRDLVRVMMGFGCNVPAVISSRACSACSRGTCISAIAFGAACSYQLGATLGVFAAMNQPALIVPYLIYLTLTTLVYTRLTSPAEARSPLNLLVIEGRTFLQWPRWTAIWREAAGTLSHFFRKAVPIFLIITLCASLLDWLGLIDRLSGVLGPALAVFRLPTEAALPILLASVRKDGILLLAESGLVNSMTPLQALTGVYLAGVLLPCLVTLLTVAREMSWSFAGRLLVRQAVAAVIFTMLLAWGGAIVFR